LPDLNSCEGKHFKIGDFEFKIVKQDTFVDVSKVIVQRISQQGATQHVIDVLRTIKAFSIIEFLNIF
jgi:hypothetical protein